MNSKVNLRFELIDQTPLAWSDLALQQFDSFLQDHAACERKAAATGMNFVVQYPDRTKLVDTFVQLAREELRHFHQVCRLIFKRGLTLRGDEKNPYVNLLIKEIRGPSEERFLDRLLIFGMIEARGCERFRLIAERVQEKDLKIFYQKLSIAEEKHHETYLEMSLHYMAPSIVEERLQQLLKKESEIFKSLPLRASVH
jgi:tRNA 2-(methylsulfanyl)-N6-isopentenyladenosine37 hydroxylase